MEKAGNSHPTPPNANLGTTQSLQQFSTNRAHGLLGLDPFRKIPFSTCT
jgi:hypothetical protein